MLSKSPSRFLMLGFSKRWFLLLLALALGSLALTLTAPGALAASTIASDGSGNDHAVKLASPAVVRIISVIDEALRCSGCASDGSDIYSPQSGSFHFVSTGSGAFISPDGYILTADHVVDHSINNPIDVDALENAAASDIAQRYNATQSDVLQFFQQNPGKLGFYIQTESEVVYLSTAYTGQLQSTAQTVSYPVSRIVANSSPDQQDTAIIKVEANDMPSLTLASSSAIAVGNSVTAIGYPADADAVVNGGDFTVLADPSQSDANTISSLLSLSVNTGQITAEKNLSDGTPEYETTGIAAPGSSGAPVIDQQGQIIGFVDASTSNDRLTFVVPSSVVTEYTRQAGADMTPGPFMKQWTSAINAYDANTPCHWTQAYKDLQVLHANYTQFGGVVPFLQNAQKQATPSECPPPPAPNRLPGELGIGIVLIVGMLVVAFLVIRRRKHITSQVQAQPQGQFNTGNMTPPPFPGIRQCPYGHIVSDPAAYNCPVCGSSLGAGTPPPPPTPYTPPYAGGHSGNTQYGGLGPATHSTTYIVTPSPTPVYRCRTGHSVFEPNAHFCPRCGAPVESIVMQESR
jgi:serine protease Do